MIIYVLRRLLLLAPVLVGITVLTFAVTRSIPTDPVVATIGQQAAEHPAIVKAYREKWGLDQPLPQQYATYVKNMLHGDLGVSIFTHRPVADDLRDYLPATVELATAAIIVSVALAIPLGILAARYRGRALDATIRVLTLIGVSMPVFWLALAALGIFYLHLGVSPGPGRLDATDAPPATLTGSYIIDSALSGQFDTLLDAAAHLVLPALVLASWSVGLLTRITRTSMLSVLHQDFLRTARSKGARELYVIRRHAFGNAMIPVITVVGLAYGDLLSGAVMTETIFSWPGIGRYAYNAAAHADFPAIMGVTIVVAAVYTLVNLAVDVLYGIVDPRVRTTIA